MLTPEEVRMQRFATRQFIKELIYESMCYGIYDERIAAARQDLIDLQDECPHAHITESKDIVFCEDCGKRFVE